MEQPKEDIGTKKDLVLYRLQTARSDLKSAKILLAAEEFILLAEKYCMAQFEFAETKDSAISELYYPN